MPFSHHPYKRLTLMLEGCKTALPANATLLLAGQSTPQPAIVQTLTAYAARVQAVVDAKLVYEQAVKARDAADPEVFAYLDRVNSGLAAYFGADNPTLGKFGVPVKHPPAKLTAEQLALKAARLRATRTARGTKGKKAKQAIKGTVPAPATAASPAAPASPVT